MKSDDAFDAALQRQRVEKMVLDDLLYSAARPGVLIASVVGIYGVLESEVVDAIGRLMHSGLVELTNDGYLKRIPAA